MGSDGGGGRWRHLEAGVKTRKQYRFHTEPMHHLDLFPVGIRTDNSIYVKGGIRISKTRCLFEVGWKRMGSGDWWLCKRP